MSSLWFSLLIAILGTSVLAKQQYPTQPSEISSNHLDGRSIEQRDPSNRGWPYRLDCVELKIPSNSRMFHNIFYQPLREVCNPFDAGCQCVLGEHEALNQLRCNPKKGPTRGKSLQPYLNPYSKDFIPIRRDFIRNMCPSNCRCHAIDPVATAKEVSAIQIVNPDGIAAIGLPACATKGKSCTRTSDCNGDKADTSIGRYERPKTSRTGMHLVDAGDDNETTNCVCEWRNESDGPGGIGPPTGTCQTSSDDVEWGGKGR
ncbi:MAG: hypothetical protein M1825_003322 [Sarcosagium campestre]|nr:MAG: hypothetical protein M1825_003322 [Sarcosagium campestre]